MAVLVGARERGVHEVAGVWLARRDGEPGAVLRDPAQLVDVADVEFRVYTVRHQVQCQRDDVDAAGFVESEDDAPLERIGRVVEVDECPRRPAKTLVGPLEEFRSTLDQHLNRDVVWNQ